MSKSLMALTTAIVAAVSLASCGGGGQTDAVADTPGAARAVAASRSATTASTAASAAASAADLPDGTYLLRNACSGKVLDVQAASQEPLASVILWDWWGGANQQWQLKRQADDGSYRIEALHSGQVLDVSGAGAQDSANVIQYPWHGGNNQRWLPQPQADGLWVLQARHSGKVLDVQGSGANGAPVQQQGSNDGCAQRWKIETMAAPAPAPMAFDGMTLHLDPQSSKANDGNDGSEAAPFKTIAGALTSAASLRGQGRKVRVLFYPGVYRDYLISGSGDQQGGPAPFPFWNLPETGAELVLEAKEPGRAIISGADVWTGWRNLGNGRWIRDWPFDWGAPKAGGTISGGPVVSEYAARRELVSVGGRRLTQVLREQDLRAGTFRVDEAANQIVIQAEGNADLNASLVEVGVRSQLFYVWNRSQITLRGLVFTHSVDRFDEQAVAFQVGQGRGCSNITIDNVRIVGNGQGGFQSFCNNVEIRNSVVSDNGYAGLFGAFASGWRLDDNTTDGNGWRAWAGGYKGWSTAGLKAIVMQDFIVKRHRSVGNLADGFWIDTQSSGVVLEDSVIANNLWNGLFLEASAGPFTVRNNLICGSGGSDVLLAAVAKVTLEGNRILSTAAQNAELPSSQSTAIFFGETRRIEPGSGDLGTTAAEYPLREITMKGNTITAEGAGRSLTGNYWYSADSTRPDAAQVRADHDVFMRTLVSDNNTWFAEQLLPFRISSLAKRYEDPYDFAGWQAVTAQDKGSKFGSFDAACRP